MLTRSQVSTPAVSFFLSIAALTTAWAPPSAMADEPPQPMPLGDPRLAEPATERMKPPAPEAELDVETLVQQVLARNPSVAQMAAASQAASARYPQVTSLDDPMFGTTVAPASIGSRDVEFGYRLEVSQKFPFPGKLPLRGQNALAEASATTHTIFAKLINSFSTP